MSIDMAAFAALRAGDMTALAAAFDARRPNEIFMVDAVRSGNSAAVALCYNYVLETKTMYVAIASHGTLEMLAMVPSPPSMWCEGMIEEAAHYGNEPLFTMLLLQNPERWNYTAFGWAAYYHKWTLFAFLDTCDWVSMFVRVLHRRSKEYYLWPNYTKGFLQAVNPKPEDIIELDRQLAVIPVMRERNLLDYQKIVAEVRREADIARGKVDRGTLQLLRKFVGRGPATLIYGYANSGFVLDTFDLAYAD